ncbi:MAG TPA: hypothetical protein VFA07_15475 [Chthonomonadaceae bacterium]|nr:hypothetical protein [Chthonomonadaceae bacterium]
MPYEPQPIVEHPNLRAPIALIVDDPAPCINPVWYFRHQVDKQAEPAHERTIPLDFMQAWSTFAREAGLRGDFTVLPYPAGLGRIDVGLEGYDRGELRDWIGLAKEFIAPQFDIHCEILTHTNALDLSTWKLLPPSEHDWMAEQDEATLANYFATAMQILGEAGLPNHGLTQPCYYHGDESMYARAILTAEKQVNHRKVTHNFLHMDGVAPFVPPRITHLDAAAGEAVVSVWCAIDDFIWNTQERQAPEATMSPEALADRFVTADGQAGRLVELINGGGPLVLVTHWQSLYSNGSRLGLRTYQEVVARVRALWSDRLAWRKLSEIASQFLAARTVTFEIKATRHSVRVRATSPFATDILTVSIPTPWPLYRGPAVQIDGQPVPQVLQASDLEAGKWLMRGSIVTASLTLEANQPREITIRPIEA